LCLCARAATAATLATFTTAPSPTLAIGLILVARGCRQNDCRVLGRCVAPLYRCDSARRSQLPLEVGQLCECSTRVQNVIPSSTSASCRPQHGANPPYELATSHPRSNANQKSLADCSRLRSRLALSCGLFSECTRADVMVASQLQISSTWDYTTIADVCALVSVWREA
jgi:hypothetical protein